MTVAPTPVSGRHRHPRRVTAVLLAVVLILVVAVVVLLARDQGTTTISVGVLGSGVAASQTRPLPAFRGIDLAGSNTLTIHVGSKQSVNVQADDNLIDVVTTVVAGGTLFVDNVGSFTTKTPMHVEITVPALRSVSLTGSGTIDVTGIDSRTFIADLKGSGVITAAGTTDRLDARLGGSGDCRLEQLKARDATARLAGSGRLVVSAAHSLDASVAGTGVIAYTGKPTRVTTTVTGTGTIVEQ